MTPERTSVTVRDATPADLDQVADLWEELIRFHHDLDNRFWQKAPDGRELFRQWMGESLAEEKRVLFVATERAQVMGFAHGMLTNSPPPMRDRCIGSVTDLVVGASHRRRGIGRRLVEAVQDWFQRQGAVEIRLTAALCNESAVAFWRAMGFEPWTVTMRRRIA